MINSIEPQEFLDMVPASLLEECKHYNIPHRQVMELAKTLNEMRAGIPITVNVTVSRLGSLDLRNNRYIDLNTSRTFLIRFAKHNLHKVTNDWQVDILQHYNYLVSKGGVVTWTICKGPGKIFPLAYKEFLKCKFQGVNMPTINKLDLFYDRYIKSYNEIYKREMDKHNQQAECV